MQEALKNRFVLECSLETLSPLHVGAEKAMGFGVDNPIIKIKKGDREIPVIPGSSIKGVLRAHLQTGKFRRNGETGIQGFQGRYRKF